MPWRLIGVVLVSALVLAFIGFNLGNACDLSVGFMSFKAVPVFMTALGGFAVGVLVSLPYAIAGSFKKKRQKPGTVPAIKADSNDSTGYGVD